VTAILGLLLGAGAFLVWWSTWLEPPAPPRKSDGWSARTADALVQAGIPRVSPASLLGASITVGVVVWIVVAGISRSPVIAACFAVIAGRAPFAYVAARARARSIAMRDVWPEAVDNLSSGIRAGLALPEALSQLGERGPEQLRQPFRLFAEDYRATGRFSDCLDALKARLADPVADRIIEALRITRDVGGTDLGRLLRTLSTFIRDDARTRGELEARQSWTVNAARLAVTAPWLVLLLLSSRPESVAAYNSGAGVTVLLLGGAATAAAYRLMVRIGRLPEDVRVLR